MAASPNAAPLASPPLPSTSISGGTVYSGLPIPPIERIKLFSPTQWEEFVLEWGDSLRSKYKRVDRCGGAGDMGRDIIAISATDDSVWDNYQCKHYQNPLTPSDVWIELGKVVYYTQQGDYTYPRKYFFVAPQGAGTSLSNLLKKPSELRSQLVTNWDKHCQKRISSTHEVVLNRALKTYIMSLDFSIFDAIPPLKLIEQHATTRWHAARFGGGLPPRPMSLTPPSNLDQNETQYVTELFHAYADHLKRNVSSIADIASETNLREHFDDARLDFYSAESLRAFSRDTLPPGEFEKLQDEILSGIKDEIRGDHPDGYRRVVAVVKTARLLQLTASSLCTCLFMRDRGGICHQLANDRKVEWVK